MGVDGVEDGLDVAANESECFQEPDLISLGEIVSDALGSGGVVCIVAAAGDQHDGTVTGSALQEAGAVTSGGDPKRLAARDVEQARLGHGVPDTFAGLWVWSRSWRPKRRKRRGRRCEGVAMKRKRMVGLLALGVLGGGAVLAAPAAQADPDCVDVWLVRQDGSREYKAQPCQETGMSQWINWGTEPTSTGVPGPYKGAGVEVWVTGP
jgi:hypothetical protein